MTGFAACAPAPTVFGVHRGYGTPDDQVEIEAERLAALASSRDQRTLDVIDRIGVEPGWTCLEVGAGTGTISLGLAERVGDAGRVWSVDKDLRFHHEMPANVEVHCLDLVDDALPDDTFDLVHARAVLQHIPERDAVLERLARTVRPGGVLLVEDGDMRAFAEQPLPEPFGTVHRLMARGTVTPWRDPYYGTRLLEQFSRLGFEDIGMDGAAGLMRPNHASGEWWLLVLDRVIPNLVRSGALSEPDAEECRRQMREPSRLLLGPLMLAIWGRRPVA